MSVYYAFRGISAKYRLTQKYVLDVFEICVMGTNLVMYTAELIMLPKCVMWTYN